MLPRKRGHLPDFLIAFVVEQVRQGRHAFRQPDAPDGQRYPNRTVFTVLEPARRVVIRHDCAPYFTLSVQLTEVPGGTHLAWEQVFDDPATAQAVKAIVVPANEQNLDRLQRALAGRA